MARFTVGDRVRVTSDTEGQPVEVIDAIGTVAAIGGILEYGTVGFGRKEQEYDVDFDRIGHREGMWESWLVPVSD